MTPLNHGYYVVSSLSRHRSVHRDQGRCLATSGTGSSSAASSASLTGIAFVYITQYYTAGSWRPVQEIANASRTGPATNIISVSRSASRRRPLTAIAIGIALVVSFVLGSQRRDLPNVARLHDRHLRHRRRDDGHADVRRLHPGDGHLRPDHRQRRRHHRDVRRAGERPRHHRRARRRRQHDQGAHQGLRGRLRRPGRLPALLRLPRRGQGARWSCR